jgi:NAD-dependent deacetylase
VSDLEPAIKKAAEALIESRSLVVSTGAGMSRESGIPTFRDAPNALWENYDPETLASPQGWLKDPPLVWRWYAERRRLISQTSPHPGHYAIAELEDHFEDFVVITQNIDDLHRKAGSRSLVEVHGNIFRYKCFDAEHEIDELPDGNDEPPRCECGSLIRPNVVWFGELLPEEAIRRSYQAIEACDTMLVVGTSGIVVPVAGFPALARQMGARIIEINPEETPITNVAHLFLQGPAGEVLPRLVGMFKELRSKAS